MIFSLGRLVVFFNPHFHLFYPNIIIYTLLDPRVITNFSYTFLTSRCRLGARHWTAEHWVTVWGEGTGPPSTGSRYGGRHWTAEHWVTVWGEGTGPPSTGSRYGGKALDHRALGHGIVVRHWTSEHWVTVLGHRVGSISPFNGDLKLGCPRRGSQEPSLIVCTIINSSSSDLGTQLLQYTIFMNK